MNMSLNIMNHPFFFKGDYPITLFISSAPSLYPKISHAHGNIVDNLAGMPWYRYFFLPKR